MDVHLLRLITKHIPTQLLLSEVAGHPACARADKLADIMYIEPPEAQHRYCIWDAHTIHVTDHPTYADAISRHLQYNTAPLLIISQDTTIPGMQQQVTIDTDTIQVNTGKFWQGNQKGSSRTTNHGDTVHPHVPRLHPARDPYNFPPHKIATRFHICTRTARYSAPRIRQPPPRNTHIHPQHHDRQLQPRETNGDTYRHPDTTAHNRGGGQRDTPAAPTNTRQ